MEILGYNDAVHRDHVVQLWNSVFDYSAPRNRPEASIDRKLAVQDGLFFVAIAEGGIVGTVMAGYDGHRGWIYSLAVSPGSRRMGIGSAILAHAETELKRLGCVKINLQIMPTNREVVDFYRKNGYRVEERISMGKEIPENTTGSS
jgi:ribosomal protein S18 acetylase RimI-like enzyme